MKDVFSGDNGGDTVVLMLIRRQGIRDCFVFAFLSLQRRLEDFRRMAEIRLNEGSSFAKSRKLFDIFVISFVSEKK